MPAVTPAAVGIVNWIQATLAAVDGTGSYNYDLSADDVVTISDMPTSTAAVGLGTRLFIYAVQVETTPGAPLTAWSQTLRCYIAGFVQGDGTNWGAQTAALKLAGDIHRALRADRAASTATIPADSSVHDVRVESEAFEGTSLGFKGRGIALVGISVLYRGTY